MRRQKGQVFNTRKRGICVSVVVFGTLIGCTLLAYTAFADHTSKNDTLQQVVFVSNTFDSNYSVTPHTCLYFDINLSVQVISDFLLLVSLCKCYFTRNVFHNRVGSSDPTIYTSLLTIACVSI